MRRFGISLIVTIGLSSGSMGLAQHLPTDVYVPSHWCAHRFDPGTAPGTEACRFDLAPGERLFNFDTFGGRGSFRIQAAFDDGVVFFDADCTRDSTASGWCEGNGWFMDGRGVTGSRFSGVFAGPLTLLLHGITALMPTGGSLTVWANSGESAGLVVRAD